MELMLLYVTSYYVYYNLVGKHYCCIQLLLLDFFERCDQPIRSATPQLK